MPLISSYSTEIRHVPIGDAGVPSYSVCRYIVQPGDPLDGPYEKPVIAPAIGEVSVIYIVENLLQILAASLVALQVGFAYRASLGRSGGTVQWRFLDVILTFVAEFWLAAILAGALILAPAKANVWVMALGSAVVIWIGFVVPALVVSLRYHRLSPRAVIGECGYWLIVMLVQSIVLESIGVSAPTH